MSLRSKAAKALVLGAAVIAAPWLARALADLSRQLVSLVSTVAPGDLPGNLGLVGLALITMLVIATRRGRIAQFLVGGLRSVIKATVIWAAVGTTLWLAALFFMGSLVQLDRIFPLAHCVVLVILLVAARTLVLQSAGIWPTVAVLTAVTLVLWSQSWPAFSLGNLGSLAGLQTAVAQLTAPPLVVPASLLTSAALALWALHVRFASGESRIGYLVDFIAWIVATHFIWLILLFAVGAVDVPRWLPIATAVMMALFGALGQIAFSLVRSDTDSGVRPYVYDPGRIGAEGTQAVLVPSTNPGAGSAGRRAWVISYTGVSNEPRVLRQCEALTRAGWDVVVCGHEGHSQRPSEWTFVRLPTAEPFKGIAYAFLALAQSIGLMLLVHGRPIGMFEWASRLVHGATPLWLHTKRELVALAKEHPELKADLVISHDYHTADVGYAVAQAYGARFSVDVHEYAAGQYFNDPNWVKWQRPVAIGVQKYFLGRADVVTVVCQGIADLLANENTLRREPVTIRSFPFKAVQPFRPVGRRIEVLYHGDLSVRREIHTLIESMRLWHKDIDLLLRGSGDPAYVADLKRQIARLNIEDRVRFEPPVPFAEIIPAANKSDIGFFSFKGDSPQIRFTLPNKFFEYIMAGLCLCVGDTEEVGRIVRQYGNGKLIATHSPEAIAEAINSLTQQDIEACKKASIAAAEQLNWEDERCRLLDAYDAIV